MISFDENAILLTTGPINLHGTKENPVVGCVIAKNDCILALSNSGQSNELNDIINLLIFIQEIKNYMLVFIIIRIPLSI